MRNVRLSVSIDAMAMIVELAEKKNLTITAAAEKLITVGYNRTASLEKWNKKGRRRAQKPQQKATVVDHPRKKAAATKHDNVRHRVAA